MKLLEEYKEFNNETYQKVIFDELFRQDYFLSNLGGEITLKGKEIQYFDESNLTKEELDFMKEGGSPNEVFWWAPTGVVCYMKPKDIMYLALKYAD